jgi:hypothetical protein
MGPPPLTIPSPPTPPTQVGPARCERCSGRAVTVALWLLARAFDLTLLAGLIWLSLRAARSWGRYTPTNTDATAAAAVSAGGFRGPSGDAKGLGGGGPEGVKGAAVSGAVGQVALDGLGPEPPLYAHLGVLLDLFHLASILGTSGLVYTWPRPLRRFAAALSLTPLGSSRWVSLDCVLRDYAGFPKSMQALLAAALPALGYFAIALVLWLASMRTDLPHVGAKPLVALLVTGGLFYPLLVWSALSSLSCVPLDARSPPGQEALAQGSYWALDTGVQCWRGSHLGLALGFGVPLLLLLSAGWLALLWGVLRHCRDRLAHRADTAAPRRRLRRRRGLVHCQQALGVAAGFLRPGAYLWPVAVEARRLVLLALLAVMGASPPLAQAYALWGVLALVLLCEWLARPFASRALLALQLAVLGAVQGSVYLGSMFSQQAAAGGAGAFAGASAALTALIILINLGAVLAFLVSLVPGLRPAALMSALDKDGDGAISAADLANAAADFLRGGPPSPGPGGSDGSGSLGGLRGAAVRALEKVAARAGSASPDARDARGLDQDAAAAREREREALAAALPESPSIAAAAAAAAASPFARANSGRAGAPRAGSGALRSGGGSEHVGLDVRTLAAATSARSVPSVSRAARGPSGSAAAGAASSLAPNGMPLASYMSINKWIEDSGGPPQDSPPNGGRAPAGGRGGGANGGRSGGGGNGASAAAPRPPSGRPARANSGGAGLRGAASTPAGELPSVQSSQRRALMQQLHDWREEDLERGSRPGPGGSSGEEGGSGEGGGAPGGSGGSGGEPYYHDSDDELRRGRPRRRGGSTSDAGATASRTGSLAASRALEAAMAAAAVAAAGEGGEDEDAPSRHRAYYSLWQSAADGMGGGSAPPQPPLLRHFGSGASSGRPPTVPEQDPVAAVVAEAAQQAAAAAAAGQSRRPNPFAAAGALAAAAATPASGAPSPTPPFWPKPPLRSPAASGSLGGSVAALPPVARGPSASAVPGAPADEPLSAVVAEAAQQAAASAAARATRRPNPFAASGALAAAAMAPAPAPEHAGAAPSSFAPMLSGEASTNAATAASLVAASVRTMHTASEAQYSAAPLPVLPADAAVAPARAVAPAAVAQQQLPAEPVAMKGRHRGAYSMWLGAAARIDTGSSPASASPPRSPGTAAGKDGPPAGRQPSAAAPPPTPGPAPPAALPAVQHSKGSSSGGGASPSVVADVAIPSAGSAGSVTKFGAPAPAAAAGAQPRRHRSFRAARARPE